MKRFVIGFAWLMAACVAVAGTGTSNEFRVDTRTGVRTAAVTEKIQGFGLVEIKLSSPGLLAVDSDAVVFDIIPT